MMTERRAEMDTGRMISELKSLEVKHRNDKVFTGQLNISEMAHDVRERLEELKPYEDTGLSQEQILELKERNTPKEAIITGYNRAIGCKVGECPKCGAMTRDYLTFCSECGQRLRWEE